MQVGELLKRAVAEGASDIYISAGLPVMLKTPRGLEPAEPEKVMPGDTARMVEELFRLAGGKGFDDYMKTGDSDFSLSLPGQGRFRVNAFMQRSSMAAVIRVVRLALMDPQELRIPDPVMGLSKRHKGLVLVTGPAGSGKTTTLACLVNQINESRQCHILTLEDPIEYMHRHKKSIVNQREIEHDSVSYAKALRAALRQSPDVILVGEMRDLETMSIALTAAETGHLVLSSLHTVGAGKTIDRIIDVFPPSQQQQVRIQLSTVLQAVVSQQLLPSAKLGRAAAFEVMTVNPAIRNLIREGKTHQIDSIIHAGGGEGMELMDMSIARLANEGLVSREDALTYCLNRELLTRYLKGGGTE